MKFGQRSLTMTHGTYFVIAKHTYHCRLKQCYFSTCNLGAINGGREKVGKANPSTLLSRIQSRPATRHKFPLAVEDHRNNVCPQRTKRSRSGPCRKGQHWPQLEEQQEGRGGLWLHSEKP